MILEILQGLWKWIKWILAIIIVGLLILALRIFVFDKDYDGVKRVSDRTSKTNGSSTSTTETGDGKGSAKGGIANATKTGYTGDAEHDYNVSNFDEWFLMYEGEQYDGAIRNMLEHQIENSKGNFYARTSITAVGFADDMAIVYEGDVEAYQKAIREMEDALIQGTYEVSFKYAGIMTYVNEIVITKK